MHSCDSLSTHFSLQCCNYITDTTTPASVIYHNCRRHLHSATAPAIFYLRVRHMTTKVSVEEILHVCCWWQLCVVGLEPQFHNWMCCKVNKVINVFHQVSHLSRHTALPDNEVREPLSAPLLPAWPNWEALVSARLISASASAHHQQRTLLFITPFWREASRCGTLFRFRCSLSPGMGYSQERRESNIWEAA